MNNYQTANTNKEKIVGTERRFRGKIIINHDHDFDIINHLTTVMGLDVETERVQTSMYDGDLHIKIYENVKRELPNKTKTY